MLDAELRDGFARDGTNDLDSGNMVIDSLRIVIKHTGDLDVADGVNGVDDDLGVTAGADDPESLHADVSRGSSKRVMVATPSAEIPSFLITFWIVRNRILISSQRDQ